jgi:hypothetical protein
MSEYRVFISHKNIDKACAVGVKNALNQFSGDLEFFISGDDIAAGEDWRLRVRSELKKSDLLMLLFTEPTRDWDWCLYEAGLFSSLDSDEFESVVCIYPPDGDPPDPLVAHQGVPANMEAVTQFIRQFITTTEITHRERPLNANITDDQIARAADAICTQFGATIQPYYTCHRVFVDLPADLGDAKSIPSQSKIEATDGTMALFGRLAGTKTWGDLVQEQIEKSAPWIDELNAVFADACAGRVPGVTTHTFRAHDGARIFRPELYRVDKKGSTTTAAVVMFTEEVSPAKVGGPLFNRLRIAERYKAEVFDQVKDDDIDDLMEKFRLIREEAKTHNVFDEESLRTSFSDEARCAELVTIGAAWDDKVGALDAAHDSDDAASMRALLGDLEELNNRYRAIVAARYAELLQLHSS